MRRLIASALAIIVVGGIVAAPAVAKKKKKKAPAATSIPLNFYLRDEVAGCDDDPFLSVVDGPDERACSYATNGIPNEAATMAGEDPDAYTFATRDGLPFVLDAAKEITTDFTLRPYQPNAAGTYLPVHAGGGQAILDVAVTGTAEGESKVIAEGSANFTNHPASPMANVKMNLKPDAALDKLEFTTLEITVAVRGYAVMTGWIVLDDPASFFTVPTLKAG